MSKSKKSRHENKSRDENSSSSSSSDSEDSATRRRHERKLRKKLKANSVKKQRESTKKHASNNSKPDSSSPSDSTESTPERKSKGATKETEVSSKRAENVDRSRDDPSHKKEHVIAKSRVDIPNASKWDSPDRQRSRRQRSSSRNRQRSGSRIRQQYQERHNSRERGKERVREQHDRPERNDRARDGYAHKDETIDRRDYRPRNDGRYRGNRSRDEYEQRSRSDHYNERRERSRDRSPRRDRYARDERIKRESQHSPAHSRQRHHRRGSVEDDNKEYEWGGKHANAKNRGAADKKPPVEKEKPNFGLSGALTEDTNKVNGIVVKYAEPPEARKPKRRWRLYPFKGETALPTLHIHRQSCFLVGRDRKVADLAVDHPSCSKQHAALQYRLVPFERDDGTQGKRVRLYLIDLESANGTFLNNKKIDQRKYYELMEKDVIKFGFSTREYVLLHENSKEDQEDDDVQVKTEPEDVPDGLNP